MLQYLNGTITERSLELYGRSWDKYLGFCQVQGQDEKQASSLLDWRSALVAAGYSPNTINAHLSAVKSIFKGALPVGEISFETYAQVRAINAVSTRALRERLRPANVTLDDEMVLEILGAIDLDSLKGVRDRALLALLATTGVRVEELSTITLSDIDWDNNLLFVLGKTDTVPRSVPISDIALEALTLWLDSRGIESDYLFNGFVGKCGLVRQEAITTTAVRDVVIDRAAAIGIRVTPHDFRRYVATKLAEGNIVDAQAMLGHKSITTTQRYVKRAALPNNNWLG